jgi:hypothetical protein
MAQTLSILGVWGPNNSVLDLGPIDGDPSVILSKVESPDPNRAQYLARLFGLPNIFAEGTFDADATPVATKLFDLTALGLTFPAGTKRLIRWRHWEQTDNDQYYVEYSRWILGGATPALLGSRRVIDAEGVVAGTKYAYGNIELHATTSGATVTVSGSSSAGVSLGNFTSGAASLTFGPSRATPTVKDASFAEDAGTIGDFRHIQVRALAVAGTATVETATINGGSEALSSPNGTNNVDITISALPPGDADLVLNSNNVELRVTGIASDETRHRIEMFIGAPVQVPFFGS